MKYQPVKFCILKQIHFSKCFLSIQPQNGYIEFRKQKYFRYILILFLFLSIPLFSAEQSSQSLKNSVQYWNDTISNHNSNVNIMLNTTKTYVSILNRHVDNFYDSLKHEEIIKDQLSFIYNSMVSSPYQYRVVASEFSNLIDSVADKYSTLEYDYSTTVKMIKNVKAQKQLLNKIILNKDNLKDSRQLNLQKKYTQVLNILEKNKKMLSEPLSLGTKQIKLLKKEFGENFQSQIKENILSFLITRNRLWSYAFVDRSFFNLLPAYLSKSKEVLIRKLPATFQSWCELIFLIIIFRLIICYFICKIISSFQKKYNFGFDSGHIKRVVGWGLLSVSFYIFYLLRDFPKSILPYQLAGVFLIKMLVDVSWFLRGYTSKKQITRHSPLNSYFWLYFTGIVFQEIELSFVILYFLWPILLFYVTYVLIKRISTVEFKLGKNIIITSITLLPIFAVLCLFGYIYLSIFLSLTLFICLLALQFGFLLSTLFKNFIIKLSHDNTIKFYPLIIRGLGIPILWTLIICFVGDFIVEQLSSQDFLLNFIKSDFTIHGIHFNMILISISIFLFFVAKTISNLISSSLKKYSVGIKNIDYSTTKSLNIASNYFIWILYIIIVLYIFNVNFIGMAVASGGFAIGLGFGLKELANNFVSGLIIIFGKDLNEGDIIEIGNIYGKILNVKIRSTLIVTPKGSLISIPNSKLTSSDIINWKKNITEKIEIGVAYGSDTRKVEEIMLEEAYKNKNVFKEPKPNVIFESFGDHALLFALFIRINKIENKYKVASDIKFELENRFTKENINIAYPQLDLHIIKSAERDNTKPNKQTL